MNCKTCKYWQPVETEKYKDLLDDSKDDPLEQDAVTNALLESVQNKVTRGVCQKISILQSDHISKVNVFVSPLNRRKGYPEEIPNAYISQYAPDLFELSGAFISSPNFGCVDYENVSNKTIDI